MTFVLLRLEKSGALFLFVRLPLGQGDADHKGDEQKRWKPAAKKARHDSGPWQTDMVVQAACGCAAAGVSARARSLRRMAFSFPPMSRRRQVRYIQVSNTTMDARAR